MLFKRIFERTQKTDITRSITGTVSRTEKITQGINEDGNRYIRTHTEEVIEEIFPASK